MDPVSSCWIWLGRQTAGYGRINIKGANGRWTATTAQRYFFILYRYDPGPDLDIAHRCHRRSCCNPHHVRPATRLVNIGDWFVDQQFTDDQIQEVARLMSLDLPGSVIADRMLAPRPYINRLMARLNIEKYQVSFDFSLEEL